jgi:hypothetical protein
MPSSTVVRITILSVKYVEGSKLCILVFSGRQHFCCKIIVMCNNMDFKYPQNPTVSFSFVVFFLCSD